METYNIEFNDLELEVTGINIEYEEDTNFGGYFKIYDIDGYSLIDFTNDELETIQNLVHEKL